MHGHGDGNGRGQGHGGPGDGHGHGHGEGHGHGHGAGHGSGPKDPSMMTRLFMSMPFEDRGLFIIRRLDMSGMKTESPTPMIRSEVHCFFYVTKGEALVAIGDQSYYFNPGECAIIPAGQFFSIRYFDGCVGYMGGFHTDFLAAGHSGNPMRSFGFLRKWGNHKVTFERGQEGYVTNIFERLCTESGLEGNKDIVRAYFTALLAEIDSVYGRSLDPAGSSAGGSVISSCGIPSGSSADNERSSTAGEQGTGNQLSNAFVEMVFDRSSHAVPVSRYAEELRVTPAHLQKNIKKITGKTPLTWINEAVILEAKSLLRNTDLPVGEIASKVGIDDPSYFARLFKKNVGVSPAVFRSDRGGNI